MKFIKYYLALGAALSLSSLEARELLVEAKAAYYGPTNHFFKRIYHHGGGIYGLEVTGEWCHGLYGFVSADIFHKKGHSLGLCTPTKIKFIPIGLGLKYLYSCNWGDLYAGLGLLPTYLHIKDCSSSVIQKRSKQDLRKYATALLAFHTQVLSKWGVGGIAKLGTNINLGESNCWFLDLFVDYSFIDVKFCCKNPDTSGKAHLSGWSTGAGIGYRFH